jgi:type I restriction enzyme R subunit
LGDEKLRAEFHVKLKHFLTTLDLVLPRPEALELSTTPRPWRFIQTMATRRYRADERLIGKEVGEKVRKLIDEHIISLGIDTKIPPVEIIGADDFDAQVDATRSSRATGQRDGARAARPHPSSISTKTLPTTPRCRSGSRAFFRSLRGAGSRWSRR